MPQDIRRHNDLIYDVGVNRGEDTAFYLKKGFRVVGIEANPELCAQLRDKFATEIRTNQLRIVEAAVARHSGPGKFYKFEKSVYGTISEDWARRNETMGLDFEEIDVQFITPSELYGTYGVPYFMKIDIEGADMLCIEGLSTTPKPKYLSIEAEKHDFAKFETESRYIESLGYTGFQLVQQQLVPFQRLPRSAREGSTVTHRFSFGSSGKFGRDLPEKNWTNLETIFRKYRGIVKRHHVFGDYALGRTWPARQALRATGLYPGWHDLHARLADG